MELYNPDFLNDRVFQGIWRRHENPTFSQLILTLSSYKALTVMAVLVIFIEYGSSRVWIILRFIIFRNVWKPLRLGDRMPDRLLSLSRGRAVMNTFVSIEQAAHWLFPSKRHPDVNPDLEGGMTQYDPGQSVWYGIASLANIMTFLFLAIALPTFLTEGAFGAPLVKSQPLPQCLSRTSDITVYASFIEYAAALQKVDSIFGICKNSLEESCFRDYHFLPPRIQKRRLDYCPFPGPVCINGTKPFEITHLNVTAYELGINSPSKLSISHKTTCAPVITEKFMLWDRDLTRGYVSARTTLDEPSANHTLVANYVVRLSTTNGPNIASKNNSGLAAAVKAGPTEIEVVPTVDGTVLPSKKYDGWDKVHQHIRRDDGHSFLIVHKAGGASYDRAMDDPFFSAHSTIKDVYNYENETAYFADREASTLACVDQYQICIPGRQKSPYCSDWVDGKDLLARVIYAYMEYFDVPYKDPAELDKRVQSIVKTKEGQAIWMDATTFMPAALSAMSLHETLAIRNRLTPQLGLLRDQLNSIRSGYVDEQWVLEVETWFMKGILDTIFRCKIGAVYPYVIDINSNLVSIIGSHYPIEWSTCGRVLFRNANYTNINFIGFCSVLGAVLFLCITSYRIEQTYNTVEYTVTSVRHPKKTCASIKTSLTGWFREAQLRFRRLFTISSYFQPSAWVSFLSSQPHMRTRTQYRGPPTQTGSAGSQQAPAGGTTNAQQGMEDIQLDNVDAENLRRGVEIDDPPNSR